MKKYAIIVAGGAGLRMGKEIPKQFIQISGKSILMWTILSFKQFDPLINITLVLPENQITYWNNLCNELNFGIPHKIAVGGKTRFHSVKNGLHSIDDNNGVVAVHDGVRPFASAETMTRCFTLASKGKNVIPVLPVVESLREKNNDTSSAVDRSKYVSVQTPQTFPLITLKEAYQVEFNDTFTDDASVVENNGKTITLVEGNQENIKITHPIDLITGEHYLSKLNL